ncbi:MAG: hypothetical protein PWP05_352 [Thermovirga sp.]|nr:hypothetical protein [Thermovirga sp.]
MKVLNNKIAKDVGCTESLHVLFSLCLRAEAPKGPILWSPAEGYSWKQGCLPCLERRDEHVHTGCLLEKQALTKGE